MGEYTYGNGLVSRTDWDPESTRRWWGTVKDREYYLHDILGSTALLTDKFAMVRERYRYDAFGNHYAGTFKRFNELGYTGKRYDGTTSLYDYGFRDYDAESGRFTTVDPIRDGRNWYAYCGNDPVNKVDLWGLSESDKNSINMEVFESENGREYKTGSSQSVLQDGTEYSIEVYVYEIFSTQEKVDFHYSGEEPKNSTVTVTYITQDEKKEISVMSGPDHPGGEANWGYPAADLSEQSVDTFKDYYIGITVPVGGDVEQVNVIVDGETTTFK